MNDQSLGKTAITLLKQFEWSKFGQNSNYLIKAIYTNLAYTHLVETIKLSLYKQSLNILQRISIFKSLTY